MKNTGKKVLCGALALLMLLSLAACGKKPAAEPAPAAEPEAESFESAGLKLTVPAEYAALLEVETAEEGLLFSVTEKASREAAAKNHAGANSGAGWMFGISRIGEEELRQMLQQDMSGRQVFARDDQSRYYLLNTPTDVRIEREGEITQADMEQWSKLYDWINGAVCEQLIRDNGLFACRYSNTGLDMLLAQIAWGGNMSYTLGGLEYGELQPADTQMAAFAEEILTRTTFTYTDRTESPDGEYLYLTDTYGEVRYKFFSGENGSVVLEERDGYSSFYVAGNDTDVHEIVARWYETLSKQEDTVSATGSPIGMANPWQEAKSAEEAARNAGLEGFTLPESLICFPEGYESLVIRWMDGLAEARYVADDCVLLLRKGLGSEDVSGDYNSYPDTWDVNWKGLNIQCCGQNGAVRLARWYFGGNAYSLSFDAGTPTGGLSEAAVTSLVNQIQ